MSATINPGICDSRLTGFLNATSETDAHAQLEALIAGDVADTMRQTIQRTLRSSRWALAQVDDILGESQLRLVRRLQDLRRTGGSPIENLLGYVSTLTEHACYGFLRRQFPEITRLRNRLRYALSHHPSIAFAPDADQQWQCQATGIRAAARPGDARVLLDTPIRFVLERQIDTRAPLSTLAYTLLEACDQPIEFDRFAEAVATLLGVTDTAVSAQQEADGGSRLERLPDPSPAIDAVIEQRTLLSQVWSELVSLPVRQRAALLLNLRDPSGGSVLQLLPGTGVVSKPDIARALEITDAQLDALWDELPLDDLSLAGRLGVTRQQVINLRKSGRSRLARRLPVISPARSRQHQQRNS